MNGKAHAGCKFLVHIDIENFFPSVKRKQVQDVYREFGFPIEMIALLTGLSVLNGILPQGAPTSPCIANIVFLPCDKKIAKLASSRGISYSRYADDLTLSSNEPIKPGFIGEVIDIIKSGGFRINKGKMASLGPGQRLMTTGLVVNQKAHPVRTLRRRLRARFHQAELHPRRFLKEANQLHGWAAYVNAYDPKLGADYLRIANVVLRLTQKTS